MWQWFLRAVQAAIFGTIIYWDVTENFTNSRPVIAIFYGVLLAFAATQGLMGLRWLLLGRKGGTSQHQGIERPLIRDRE